MTNFGAKCAPFFIGWSLVTVAYFHGHIFPYIFTPLQRELASTLNDKGYMVPLSNNSSKHADGENMSSQHSEDLYMTFAKQWIQGVEDRLKQFENLPSANNNAIEERLKKLEGISMTHMLMKNETQTNNEVPVNTSKPKVGNQPNVLDAQSPTVVSIPNHTEFWNTESQPQLSRPQPPPEDMWLLGTSPNTNMSSIPKDIYKVFLQKSGGFPTIEDLPTELRDAHHSWLMRNPGYEMHYFDLTLARRYLAKHFHPVFLRAFDCIEAFAGKTNLIRVAIIYREGGWYSDWKQVCLQDNLLDRLSTLKVADGAFFRSVWCERKGQRHSIQNAFFGARPRNPVVAKALKTILVNVQSEYYGTWPTAATGTGVLGLAFKSLNDKITSGPKMEHAGFYNETNNFFFEDKAVVKHKCDDCGMGRDSWANGNDYTKLHKHKTYYCQTAASIFAE